MTAPKRPADHEFTYHSALSTRTGKPVQWAFQYDGYKIAYEWFSVDGRYYYGRTKTGASLVDLHDRMAEKVMDHE